MNNWKVYQDPTFPNGKALMGYKGKSQLATGRVLRAFASSRITNELIRGEHLDVVTTIGALDDLALGEDPSVFFKLAYPPIKAGTIVATTSSGGLVVMDDHQGVLTVRDVGQVVGDVNYRTGQVRLLRGFFLAAAGLLVSYDWTSE